MYVIRKVGEPNLSTIGLFRTKRAARRFIQEHWLSSQHRWRIGKITWEKEVFRV